VNGSRAGCHPLMFPSLLYPHLVTAGLSVRRVQQPDLRGELKRLPLMSAGASAAACGAGQSAHALDAAAFSRRSTSLVSAEVPAPCPPILHTDNPTCVRPQPQRTPPSSSTTWSSGSSRAMARASSTAVPHALARATGTSTASASVR